MPSTHTLQHAAGCPFPCSLQPHVQIHVTRVVVDFEIEDTLYFDCFPFTVIESCAISTYCSHGTRLITNINDLHFGQPGLPRDPDNNLVPAPPDELAL